MAQLAHRTTTLHQAIAVLGIAAAVVFALLSSPAWAAQTTATGIDIEIRNNSGQPDSDVYVMFTAANGSADISDARPIRLTDLPLSSRGHRHFRLDRAVAGRVWLSFDNPVTAVPEPSPDTSTTRFDVVELTYTPETTPAVGIGNLSAVAMFGIPLDLVAVDNGGTMIPGRFRGLDCFTDVIRQQLAAAGVPASAERQTTDGGFARIVAPATRPGPYPDLIDYVQSLAGETIRIQGRYYGTEGAPAYDYTGTFAGDGSITLTGTAGDGANQTLFTSGTELAKAGYSQNGPYTVGGSPANVGQNDVYAAIYRDLVAGLSYGYWGGVHGNDSATYAADPPPTAFAAARPGGENFTAWNVYGSVINANSTIYGMPFSDHFGNNGKPNPLVRFDDAAALQVTIQPDSGCRADLQPPSGEDPGGGSPGGGDPVGEDPGSEGPGSSGPGDGSPTRGAPGAGDASGGKPARPAELGPGLPDNETLSLRARSKRKAVTAGKWQRLVWQVASDGQVKIRHKVKGQQRNQTKVKKNDTRLAVKALGGNRRVVVKVVVKTDAGKYRWQRGWRVR